MSDTEKPNFRLGNDGEIVGLILSEDQQKKKKGVPTLWRRITRLRAIVILSHILIASSSLCGLVISMSAVKSGFDSYWNSRCPKGDFSIHAKAGKITFSSHDLHDTEIVVIDENGSNWRSLTTDHFNDDDSSISPDGKQVAFISRRHPDGVQIYVANTDGSRVHRLNNHYAGQISRPLWSPDGTQVAFLAQPEDRYMKHTLYVMDAKGTYERELTNDVSPYSSFAWSPDGTSIALVLEPEGETKTYLYVVYARGTYEKRLTDLVDVSSLFAWSPDGKQIAFVSKTPELWPNDDGPIYVVNADGSNQHLIIDEPGSKPSLIWSPDGRSVIFSTPNHLARVNLDGSNRQLLYVGTLISGKNIVAASPNGKLIALPIPAASTYGIPVSYDLLVMNPDGSDQRRVTHHHHPYSGQFTWLPDSQHIAYIADYQSNYNIYIADIGGANERRLCVQWFS